MLRLCLATFSLLIFAATTYASKFAIGLTSAGNPIVALEEAGGEGSTAAMPVVVLIGGLDGEDPSSPSVTKVFEQYYAGPAKSRKVHLIAIPVANRERSVLAFPPDGPAYKNNTEANYLWRWLSIRAPDLVLIAGKDFGLAAALSAGGAGGVGAIPARRVRSKRAIWESLQAAPLPSPARKEIALRQSRTPLDLANELEKHYGSEWPQAVYVPGMALIGRMRLGHTQEVQHITEPFLNDQNPLEKATGSNFAGHLVFAELAERTGDRRYVDLVTRAANSGFGDDGQMLESMPFHNEMSDAVFMSCPILVKAGKLTGKTKYFDMALRHFRFMEKLCLRADGLYRHSPLNEAAWGRGNAFPLLGLALSLEDLPNEHDARAEMLEAFRKLARTLRAAQNKDGMWRQVIDKPGAYSEFSATAMIGTALQRGIRRGWLDAASFQSTVEAAWKAILARTKNGVVVDVCESTGKQKTLEDYLNRTAILGVDQRGGGMAFMFATEMAELR